MPLVKNSWIQPVILIAILAAGLIWLKAPFQTARSDSTVSTSEGVPAPEQGQKKVVLSKLGMT